MESSETSKVFIINPSVYATQSKLATGRWVKITIPDNGVYEITYSELRKMGFSNPGKVHVYGVGGNRINEKLNGTAVDTKEVIDIPASKAPVFKAGKGLKDKVNKK